MIKIHKLILIAAAFAAGFSYAANPQNTQSKVHYAKKYQAPKTYTLIVTSANKSKAEIPFDAAILSSSAGKESTLTNVHTTTPYKITVTEEYVSYMIKTDLKNPQLHIETFENGEVHAQGWGHVFEGNETVYPNMHESSYIIVLN